MLKGFADSFDQMSKAQDRDRLLSPVDDIRCNDSINTGFDLFRDDIGRIEIKTFWNRDIRGWVTGIMMLMSSTTIPISHSLKSSKFIIGMFNMFERLILAPSLFRDPLISTLLLLSLCLFFLIVIGSSISIAMRYTHDGHPHDFSLKLWLMTRQYLLPLPGMLIGKQLGYFIHKFTQVTTYSTQLALSITSMCLWLCSVSMCAIVYNGGNHNRNEDKFQIKFPYTSFEVISVLIPVLNVLLPQIYSIFSNDFISSIVHIVVSCIFSLSAVIFILIKRPFIVDRMNWKFIFFFASMAVISPLWFISQKSPQLFDGSVFMVTGLVFILYFLTKVIGLRCTLTETEDTSLSDPETEVETDIQCQYRYFSFHLQDLFLTFCMGTALVMMMLFNSLAAQRMPTAAPLPDIILDKFPVASKLRMNGVGSFQFSNFACMAMAVLLVGSLLVFPNIINVRKALFVYSILAAIRSVSFLVTSLPPPCAGTPNCPCADPVELAKLRSANPIVIAASWLFGLGMFLTYPQCGDLIISGHTMYLWLALRVVLNVINVAFRSPMSDIISGSLIVFVVSACAYIIVVRNHYSIDVWLGVILTEIIWIAYSGYEQHAENEPSEDDSFLLRIIRWLETRSVPIQKRHNQHIDVPSEIEQISP